MAKPIPRLSPDEIRSVIDLAWNARPPYTDVMTRHGLSPGQVVQLLKRELTPNAYKLWASRGGVAPRRVGRRR
jgi:uncharacterized protein (TIGR03643 family)